MQPQYIYEAFLIPGISRDEIAVLENGYEIVLDSKKHRVEQPITNWRSSARAPRAGIYRAASSSAESIFCPPARIYDQQGNVATDAHYQDYKDYDGNDFPEYDSDRTAAGEVTTSP
jgi:hypothetical protein